MTNGADGQLETEHPDATDAWGDEPEAEATETDAASEVADPALGEESADSATGNLRVDEAVARLAELHSLPTSEHADVYEDVHRRLHTALTDLDSD